MEDLNLSPEEIEVLMALAQYPEELEDLRRKQDLYETLRYRDGPDGRQAGRVYVAASPFETLADMYLKYQSGKKLKDVEGRQKEIYGNATNARKMYLDLLRGRGQMSGVGPRQTGPVDIQPPASIPMSNAQVPAMQSAPSIPPTPSAPMGVPNSPSIGGPRTRGGLRRPRTPSEQELILSMLRGRY